VAGLATPVFPKRRVLIRDRSVSLYPPPDVCRSDCGVKYKINQPYDRPKNGETASLQINVH
jgi:hypothetical protein